LAVQLWKVARRCLQVLETSIKQLAGFDFTKTDRLDGTLFTLDLLTRAPLLQQALVGTKSRAAKLQALQLCCMYMLNALVSVIIVCSFWFALSARHPACQIISYACGCI
jgi:hypothetical protein